MVNLAKIDRFANYSRDDLRSKFKQASLLATMQEMLSRLSIQCFHMCVPQPEDSLDSRERSCISLCMDRYMDSFNLVARAYSNRLQAELKKSQEQAQKLKEAQQAQQEHQDESFVGEA